MKQPDIVVCDQTIREGMQYRGMVFTEAERLKIIAHQEALGVDISQVAYPSAHHSERKIFKSLLREAQKREYRIRVGGLGRALPADVEQMTGAGAREIHLHTGEQIRGSDQSAVFAYLRSLKPVIEQARTAVPDGVVLMNILDMGRIDGEILKTCVEWLSCETSVNMITLPDTSGCMAPNTVYAKIQKVIEKVEHTPIRIGVHCHNDLGMASANTVMGAVAGASCIEVSAFGIGERNGIGDLFLVCKTLRDQGYALRVDTDNIEGFQSYYTYVDQLVRKKTGSGLLGYDTPFFGEAMQTHVAGTHGSTSYGIRDESRWVLNVLCGRHLVQNFLSYHKIDCPDDLLPQLVSAIKEQSAAQGNSIGPHGVIAIIGQLSA